MAAVVVAVRRQEHISEGVDDVMVHLPPKESRLREGLVNKKIAAGGSGRWEPRHALYTEKMFSLSRPSANECIHALQFVSPFLLDYHAKSWALHEGERIYMTLSVLPLPSPYTKCAALVIRLGDGNLPCG